MVKEDRKRNDVRLVSIVILKILNLHVYTHFVHLRRKNGREFIYERERRKENIIQIACV